MSKWDEPVAGARRAVLAAGTVGLAGALAGCAVYGRQPAAPPPPAAAPPSPAPAGTSGAETPGTPEPGATADGGEDDLDYGADQGAGTQVATTGDVAVGGGYISAEHNVVVTQPAAGQYRAFSATCTHAGCPVSSVSDGTINCACHGSRFSIVDGSVQGGPAPAPLAEVPLTVNGDSLEI